MLGFFSHTQSKAMSQIPKSLPPKAGRTRFTTEEYMNSLYQPETVQVQPGCHIASWNSLFSGSAQAHLITEHVSNGSKIETVQHVVMNGVHQ